MVVTGTMCVRIRNHSIISQSTFHNLRNLYSVIKQNKNNV